MSVDTKIQLRLVFLFLTEDKNRNVHFKALGPRTEIILKPFQCSWRYMSIFSLHAGVETSQAKPASLPKLRSIRKGYLWSPKQTFQWDKNGQFPSAKEMAWGTNLGSGYRQGSHHGCSHPGFWFRRKDKSFVKIQTDLSQNTVSLASMNDSLDFC